MSVSGTSDRYELTPQRCLRLLVEQRRLWIAPAIACGIIAMVYAIFMTRLWEAHQGLVVREEASVTSNKQPGKFADLYEMRTFQETLLELAKSHQVVTATMMNVAQAETGQAAPVPDAEQIEKFRKRLSMSPANGAEFGKTEVFYFSVKDPSRERAIRLVAELTRQLSLRLGELRRERSQGLISELEKQVELATEAHQAENQRLKEFETNVGGDLGELRTLHSAMGGQSDLRQQLVELEKESRIVDARLHEAEDLLMVLHAAQDDPQQLVAMPGSLLKIQPTLQRLKNGLVDAQLQVSKLGGNRTAEHPQVKAATEAVEKIREELHRELAVVIEGLQVDIGLSNNRQEVLNLQIADMQSRLNRLAEFRAEYSSRVASVDNSRLVLNQVRKQLSEVQAKQVAALNAHLITAIDSPETGPYPVGLGRTMVVILGTFGGLVLGLAWLFLNVPTANSTVEQPELPAASAAATGPWLTPLPAKKAEPAFDFSTYTKKSREVAPVAAGVVENKPASAPPVVVTMPLSSAYASVNPPSLT
jgi:polysaccharide biosynthesis transport protein